MKKRTRRGFTLPEILVTVTVIAVLAAVVVPAVTQFASKGDGPQMLSDINALKTAISSYATDHRAMPTTLYDLTQSDASGGPYLQATLVGGTATTAATWTTGGAALVFSNLQCTSHALTVTVAAANSNYSTLSSSITSAMPGQLTGTTAVDANNETGTLTLMTC